MPTPRLNPSMLYRIKTKKVPFAVGRPLPGGRFLVLANSKAAAESTLGLQTASQADGASIRRRRDELIDLGVLAKDGDRHLVFTQDFTFMSCHDAAAIVKGQQSANGFTEWKPLF